MALIDGYGNHDVARLTEVLGDQFVPFTSAELAVLQTIPACIIDVEWFQNKTYRLDVAAETEVTPIVSVVNTTACLNGEVDLIPH